MNNSMGFGDRATPEVGLASASGLGIGGWCQYELRDEIGRVIAEGEGKNLVVNTGIDWILDNDTNSTTLYVGLLAASPTIVAGTTITVTKAEANLSNTVRPTWVKALASQVLSNSATKAAFTFNAGDTIGGALIATSDVKNTTSGTLIAAKSFAGNLVVANGYTLTVQYDITGSST